MNRLTREQINAWRDWYAKGYAVDFNKPGSGFLELCDLALQSLSQESVRSEADERIRIAELNALAARGAALEEAAKVCEEWRFPPENYEAADRWNRVGGYMNAIAGATDACAAAIRALQSTARVAEGAMVDPAVQRLWCEAIVATQDGSSGRMICDVEKLLHYVNSRRDNQWWRDDE